MKLFDYLPSQNGYKIRMLLSLQDRKIDTHPVSIFEGEAHTPAFLEKNPMGAVPVLELDSGDCIAESNAILCYLAEGGAYLPTDTGERAKVLQWLFVEQNYIEPVIGALRHWMLTGKLARRPATVVDARRVSGARTLGLLERHLAGHEFLANDRFSIADIAVYAYTHLAHDAGFDLAAYPALRAWIARVAATCPQLPPVVPYSVDPHACKELA